jgi:AAA family ATP:ADP antiporter
MMVTMAGIVVLVAVVSSIADFQLDLALQGAYGGDGGKMVAFLAAFRFWAGVVAVLFQLLVAGRLLERFGVKVALLLLPGAIFLGSAGVLLTGGLLWVVVMPRAADSVLKFTVNDTAFNLLYLPVPRRVRTQAKAVLDGMVKPVVLSALAIVFMLVTKLARGFGVVHWSVPALVLVGLVGDPGEPPVRRRARRQHPPPTSRPRRGEHRV